MFLKTLKPDSLIMKNPYIKIEKTFVLHGYKKSNVNNKDYSKRRNTQPN